MFIKFFQSLPYPFQDDKGLSKLLVGWLLRCIPILNFIALGYTARTFRRCVEESEDKHLPDWNTWGEDFQCGVMLFAIVFAYFYIPCGVFLVLLKFGINLFLLIFVPLFFMPMALANFVLTEEWFSAFDFKDIWKKVSFMFGDYTRFYILFLVVHIIGALCVIDMKNPQLVSIRSHILLAGYLFYITLVLSKLFAMIFPFDVFFEIEEDSTDNVNPLENSEDL